MSSYVAKMGKHQWSARHEALRSHLRKTRVDHALTQKIFATLVEFHYRNLSHNWKTGAVPPDENADTSKVFFLWYRNF